MRLPILLVLAFTSSLAAAELPAGWKNYSSEPGAFVIAFPSAPKVQKEPIEGVDGGEKVEQIQYIVGQANGAYMASFQPAPKLSQADAATISAALDQARDRLAAAFGGQVLSTKEIKIGTATGKEIVVDCPKIQGMIRSRLLLANGRFYQIMLIGQKSFVGTKEADAFLESFALAKPQQAK